MLEEKLLIWKFNRGSNEVLTTIYERYKHDLVTLATALLTDVSAAEDVVHDVFVSFIKSCGKFRLTGSLRCYLATCVANSARNKNRAVQKHRNLNIEKIDAALPDLPDPETCAISTEEERRLLHALQQLPYEQREALTRISHRRSFGAVFCEATGRQGEAGLCQESVFWLWRHSRRQQAAFSRTY